MKARAAVVIGITAVVAATGCGARNLKNEVMVPPPAETAGQTNSPIVKETKPAILDDNIADRVVAVVNNDAITLGELLESLTIIRHESQSSSVSDSDLTNQILARLIDSRLQLQEAERDKVTVEDAEVTEELTERMKKLGSPSQQEFEAWLAARETEKQ